MSAPLASSEAGPWRRAGRRLRRHRAARLGAFLLVTIVLACLLGPLLADLDPVGTAPELRLVADA